MQELVTKTSIPDPVYKGKKSLELMVYYDKSHDVYIVHMGRYGKDGHSVSTVVNSGGTGSYLEVSAFLTGLHAVFDLAWGISRSIRELSIHNNRMVVHVYGKDELNEVLRAEIDGKEYTLYRSTKDVEDKYILVDSESVSGKSISKFRYPLKTFANVYSQLKLFGDGRDRGVEKMKRYLLEESLAALGDEGE